MRPLKKLTMIILAGVGLASQWLPARAQKDPGSEVLTMALRARIAADSFVVAGRSGLQSEVPVAPTTASAWQPAGLIATAPMILISRLGWTDREGPDLTNHLRASAATTIVAHRGAQSASHHCLAELEETLRVRFEKALDLDPAKAIIDGTVDLACVDAPSAVPLILAGKVAALIVAADDRIAAIWDVPSANEVGLPQFATTAWFGIYVRPSEPMTQDTAAAMLNTRLQAALADPAILSVMAERGLSPMPLTHRSPEAHRAFLDRERERTRQ